MEKQEKYNKIKIILSIFFILLLIILCLCLFYHCRKNTSLESTIETTTIFEDIETTTIFEDIETTETTVENIIQTTSSKIREETSNTTTTVSNYSIFINNINNNGKIICPINSAKAGEEITFIVIPNSSFYKAKVQIIDNNNSNIDFICAEDDVTYTFIMPDNNVTINVGWNYQYIDKNDIITDIIINEDLY